MSPSASDQPLQELPGEAVGGNLEQALPPAETAEASPPGRPQVTFRGNTYDLISLGSLVTGAMLLFSCLTCNLGYYCLPFISLVLGVIGVLSARQAVEAERTKLWSWLGIAAGGLVLLLIALFFVLYVGFIVLAIATGQNN